MAVNKELLKNGVQIMKAENRISSDLLTEAEEFIDSISKNDFLEVKFSDFDQASSEAEWSFDDAKRTATNASGVDKELITSALSISNAIIKAIKIKATTEDVTFLISKDGTTFFEVDGMDINESIASDDTFKLKIKSGDNVIQKAMIIFEQNY
jgi:hypothetical protein